MILFELTQSEQHPVYQALEVSNGDRQYSFLRSVVIAALEIERPFLSQTVLKALNFYAIGCLHVNAGAYRPCEVAVGGYNPPAYYRVQALMDDFVNDVNRFWENHSPVALAAFVLWKLNFIHPFINGNGRTARAASYYTLCLKAGGLLPGAPMLPELLRTARDRYVLALQAADASIQKGNLDTSKLQALISELIIQQLESANPS